MLTDDNPAAVTHLRSDGSWINTLVDVIRHGGKAEGAVDEEDKKGKGKAAADSKTGVEGSEIEQEEKSDMLLRVLASGTIRHISPLPPLLPVAALDLEKTLIIPLLDQLLDLDLTRVSTEVARLSADLVSRLPRVWSCLGCMLTRRRQLLFSFSPTLLRSLPSSRTPRRTTRRSLSGLSRRSRRS